MLGDEYLALPIRAFHYMALAAPNGIVDDLLQVSLIAATRVAYAAMHPTVLAVSVTGHTFDRRPASTSGVAACYAVAGGPCNSSSVLGSTTSTCASRFSPQSHALPTVA